MLAELRDDVLLDELLLPDDVVQEDELDKVLDELDEDELLLADKLDDDSATVEEDDDELPDVLLLESSSNPISLRRLFANPIRDSLKPLTGRTSSDLMVLPG